MMHKERAMLRTTTLLLVAAAVLVATSVISDARARDNRPVPVKDDRNEAFKHFERLLPLVVDGPDGGASEVREALAKSKSEWLTIAALEAVRQGEVDKRDSGKVFLPEVLGLLGKDARKLHEEVLVPVNVIACLGELARNDDEATLKVVRALIDWHKWSENKVVRLRHMAERILLDLTGEDVAFYEETIPYWEWWVRQKELKASTDEADKPPEKKSKTAPIIFKEPMVGTHVVFVIDVSDSMKWPIKEKDIPKIKKAAAHLNWDEMPDPPTPMALAKAELVYSLDKLRPDKDDNGKKKKGSKGSKKDPEMRQFAIITYSTEVDSFTGGWIEATDKNCNTWMSKVEELETESMTNIHEALIEAFQLNDSKKKPAEHNIPTDKDCVLTGAHTIVFLTDGYPTWSRDSTAQTGTDQWGRENQIGNGEYVKREKLIELERFFNRFRKVVINTVGIGNHDKDLMKAFAENTGGGYTDWFCEVDW
jgi:hypothetical protein